MAAIFTFEKQPGEAVTFESDWTQKLEDEYGGGTLSSPSVTILTGTGIAPDLVLGTVALLVGNKGVKFRVTNGQDGQRYKLRLRVNHSSGDLREADYYVQVKEN
ncbi:MAG: hypothetical protein RLZZ524_831 [Pseudomonadota bacterium]